ncbi:GH1 family beta-glucosidase [Sphaerisporangium rubeum]|uniref:Beta-glucosidase n=1 Tax=Sphaerisporangium rubeum TaxID=321317 RepID=A0A7X0M9R1_9ACTN|nr:beta-galactosidase [Sphaerisporangium rubeum]
MTATTMAARGKTLVFPEGFVWGAATAAYQVEGAVDADGRGPSIWDVFGRRQGAILQGHTGEIACDHYNRYAEDVGLMDRLDLMAYRFSVSWPRVMPAGAGAVNAAGLGFYDRLVDRLLAAGITPYVTLYHWDLPQALEDAGGWASRDTAYRLADYARVVYERLGDRVGTWMTVNEPWVSAFIGYGIGAHAPGRTSMADAFRAAHHLLLAHGLTAQALRADGAATIALMLNLAPVMTPGQVNDPAAELSPEDAEAVERVDALLNRQFLDPALRGEYPARLLPMIERTAGLGHIRDGDLTTIKQPVDLLGINYYTPCVVRYGPGEPANAAYPGTEDIEFCGAYAPTTAMGWPIVPTGLSRMLERLTRDHPGVGLLVTENGAAFDDVVTEGRVRDADRVAYLDAHLRAAYDAIQAGADLRGYLVWSLLDNFEWAEGYTKRFGIVHVDYATQRRLLKDSALWYRDVIRRNGLHNERARRPTLEAVAARAGVSRSTVSRVINGEATVSDEFRATVMQAVDELGYVPNSAARSLVTERTDGVALIVPDAPWTRGEDPAFSVVVRSAGHALEEAGKHVTLVLAGSSRSRSRAESYVAGGQVDGAVLLPGPAGDPLRAALLRTGVPVVALGRSASPGAMPYVDADNTGGAVAAVRHLLSAGRRRVAMIGGPLDSVAAQDRLTGYEQVLAEQDRRPMIALGSFSRTSGAEAMRRLLEDDPELDAVFAANDLMAIGALSVLHETGRRVPDDVAVIGFDDIDAAAFTIPPLTTIRTSMHDQARAAIRLLLRHIEGGPAGSVILPTDLIIRSSA